MPRDSDSRGGFPSGVPGGTIVGIILTFLAISVFRLLQQGWESLSEFVSNETGRLAATGAIFLVGLFLYWVRESHTVKYAVFELVVGLLTGWAAAGQMKPEPDLGSWLGFSGAAYLVVRGCDNFAKGLKKLKELPASLPPSSAPSKSAQSGQ